MVLKPLEIEVFMNITLYKCNDDPKRAVKRLSGIQSLQISVDFHNDKDIVNPVVVTHTPITGLTGFNYAHIVDYNRYYFVTYPTSATGATTILYLSCDVLMTAFMQGLGNKPASIVRSGKAGINYITDTSLPINQYTKKPTAIQIGINPVADLSIFDGISTTPNAVLICV